MNESEIVQFGVEVNEEQETFRTIADPPTLSHFFNQSLKNIREENLSRDSLKGSIESALVADSDTDAPTSTSVRYANRKPVLIFANIHKKHLYNGEDTNRSRPLRTIIRNRGYVDGRFPDDCGHVVSCKLSGYMVDYNLFPQQMQLNRGNAGSYVFWKCFEAAMILFLRTVPKKYHPRVEYTMALNYDDPDRPDRPSSFLYFAQFFVTDDDSSSKGDKNDKERELLKFGRELLNAVRQSTTQMNRYNVRTAVVEAIRRFKLEQGLAAEILRIVEELEYVQETLTSFEEESGDGWGITDYLDFVPVVGGVKGIGEGVRDLYDGNLVDGIGNIALGGASLASDFATLGLGSTLAKGSVKAVGVAAGKSALKKGGRRAIFAAAKSLIFKK